MALLHASDMEPFLPHILVLLQASIWGRCPLKPVPLIEHDLSHPSSFHLAQASFETSFYLHVNTLTVSSQLFLFTPPVKVEQCSATSAHKIQTPGNRPKERMQQKAVRLLMVFFKCRNWLNI